MQLATSEVVMAIKRIGSTIGSINEITTTIAAAIEQQAAGETGAAATEVLAAAGELGRQADTLCADVGTFLANIRAA